MKHLTKAELTDLIWTAIEGLGSASPFRVQAAADMLLTTIREHGAKLETVSGWGAHSGWAGAGGGRGTPGSQHPGARASGGLSLPLMQETQHPPPAPRADRFQ